jgi:hypothetical protein
MQAYQPEQNGYTRKYRKQGNREQISVFSNIRRNRDLTSINCEASDSHFAGTVQIPALHRSHQRLLLMTASEDNCPVLAVPRLPVKIPLAAIPYIPSLTAVFRSAVRTVHFHDSKICQRDVPEDYQASSE